MIQIFPSIDNKLIYKPEPSGGVSLGVSVVNSGSKFVVSDSPLISGLNGGRS